MGSQKNIKKSTQAHIQATKAKHLQTIATKLASQNAWKHQSPALSKVVQQQRQVVKEIIAANEQVMDEQEQRHIAKDILNYIKTKLWIYLEPKN